MADDNVHIEHVSEWMKRASRLSPDQLAELFEKALTALWLRTYSTLGAITVTAIVDRVLCNAAEKYSIVSSLKLDTNGINFDEFHQHAGSISDRALRQAIEFVLVELLMVVGNLTAEVLTPALHSELSNVILTDSPGNERGEKKL